MLSLSLATVVLLIAILGVSHFVAFGVGFGTGRDSQRREECARQNGVDPFWIDPRSDGE